MAGRRLVALGGAGAKEQAFPNLAFLAAAEQHPVRQDDAHAAIGLEAGEHVLGKGQVAIAAWGCAVEEAAVGVGNGFVVG